uniref:Somatoliberin n=1 Tax=Callorhinchus milii TaxID=7868 RepID=A0A4W3JFK6_CALMI
SMQFRVYFLPESFIIISIKFLFDSIRFPYWNWFGTNVFRYREIFLITFRHYDQLTQTRCIWRERKTYNMRTERHADAIFTNSYRKVLGQISARKFLQSIMGKRLGSATDLSVLHEGRGYRIIHGYLVAWTVL